MWFDDCARNDDHLAQIPVMIKAKLSARVSQLIDDRVPFVLATVVRARRPTSVRPGDTAVVLPSGAIEGFVGGQCAESSVRLHAMRALETGDAILLRLIPGSVQDEHPADGIEGAVIEHNPCLSGGALEIFLEPQLPAARVLIVGGSPVGQALEHLALACGYAAESTLEMPEVDLAGATAVVVASHGNHEEDVLSAALSAGVPYVALVASVKRGEAVRASLDLPPELSAQLHTPAGLDIGARTPEEIAISILAQLVVVQRVDPALGRPAAGEASEHAAFDAGEKSSAAVTGKTKPEAPMGTGAAVDPICGMRVAITASTPQLEVSGSRVYFCGSGCRDAFVSQHAPDAAKR